MGIFKDLGFVNRNGKISAADSASLGGKTFNDIVNMKPLMLDKSSTSTLLPSALYNSSTRIPLTLTQPLNEGVWKKFEFVVTNLNPQITSMTSSSINSVSVNLGTLSNYTVDAGTGDVAIDLVFSDYTLLTKMTFVSSNTNNMMPKTWELYIKTSSGYVLSDSGVSYVFSGTANIDMDGGFATEYRLVIKKDWYGNKGNGLLIGSLSFSYTGYTGVSVNGKQITRVSYNDSTKTAVYSDICDTRTLKDIIFYGTCDTFTHKLYKDYGTDRWGITEDVDGSITIDGEKFNKKEVVTLGDNTYSTQIIPDATEFTYYPSGYDFSGDWVLEYNVNQTFGSVYNAHYYCYGTGINRDAMCVYIHGKQNIIVYLLSYVRDVRNEIVGPYIEENTTYNIKIVSYNDIISLFVDDVYCSSSVNTWTFSNDEELRWGGYDGIDTNYLFYGTMNDGRVFKNFTFDKKIPDVTITQELTQPNWREYQVIATNLEGSLIVNGVEQTVDYTSNDEVVFKSVSCDTNSLTFTANGSVQELSVNLWVEE